MAEENQNKYETTESSEVEIKDRGVFDFLGKKKEEKPQEEVIVIEFDEKVKVYEEHDEKEGKKDDEGEKTHSLLEKLDRSSSSSSSSSDEEEVEEGGEKKRMKKKKEKKGLKEKIGGGDHKDKDKMDHEDTTVQVEKVEVDPAHPEEKKGFLDKIKEKLPGHKKTEEATTAPPAPPPPSPPASSDHYSETTTATTVTSTHEGEAKEKKGILEKIKEKLPGNHPKSEEEKGKESASH